MAMNEYGEIVRSNNQTPDTSDNISNNSSDGQNSFSDNVMNQFTVTRKRNFNIITLIISIPLYAIIGYFAAEYFQYKEITENIGALIGGVAALICTLIYNNKWAKIYKSYEYLISLLFPGIIIGVVTIAIVIIVAVVKLLVELVKIIVAIVIGLAILAGLAGG